jgi:hypothetical protein
MSEDKYALEALVRVRNDRDRLTRELAEARAGLLNAMRKGVELCKERNEALEEVNTYKAECVTDEQIKEAHKQLDFIQEKCTRGFLPREASPTLVEEVKATEAYRCFVARFASIRAVIPKLKEMTGHE